MLQSQIAHVAMARGGGKSDVTVIVQRGGWSSRIY